MKIIAENLEENEQLQKAKETLLEIDIISITRNYEDSFVMATWGPDDLDYYVQENQSKPIQILYLSLTLEEKCAMLSLIMDRNNDAAIESGMSDIGYIFKGIFEDVWDEREPSPEKEKGMRAIMKMEEHL